MNFIDTLDVDSRKALEKCMRSVRFKQGMCLIHEGDPGDGCYLIDAGEIRIELRHMDTDSEAVLCHLGPGALLGEFSLVDDQPRSASAYAQTDSEVRWLSKSDFQGFCQEHPNQGVNILLNLSHYLADKLRTQNRLLAEHIFIDEADRETQNTVAHAVAAQKDFVPWSEEKVDVLLQDISTSVAAQAERLAEANVADSGIGVVADKVQKIRFACNEVCRILMGKPAAGFIKEDWNQKVLDIASPVGVVLGIIPVTNPVSTIVFKTLICLKGRNALIYSCHRDAMRVGNMVGEIIQASMHRHGAPEGLVQWIKKRTDRKKTMMYMKHPDVSFILATGGPSIVQSAYSSGTPAIGVGSGNAPVLVCADADPQAVAKKVIQGKSFDNGVICGSENNLVVVQSVRAELIKGLESNGAAVLIPDEKNRLAAVIFDPESASLKRDIVGKSAEHIAGLAGIRRANPIRLLVVPVDLSEIDTAFGYEKLAPILSLFTVKNEDEGISISRRILEQQGIGHTAIIHTHDEALARRYGQEIPAGRILVNVSGSQGCIGIGTGLTPSFTLGCGTYGGNSTTDNVTYTHLLNVKRLSFGFAS